MNTLRLVPLAASLALLALSGSAHAAEPTPAAPAYTYYIEHFQVDKEISGVWTTLLSDGFDSATNALAPDLFAPNYLAGSSAGSPADYGVFGSFAADSLDGSGKLRLDNNGAALSSDPFGNPVYAKQARLLTSTNNTDTNGLKRDTSFMVTAIFDLTAPIAGGAYGIRLTDQGSTTANDAISLLVRNSASGINIDFRKADALEPSNVTLDSEAATFGTSQIGLNLYHDNSLVDGLPNQLVYASFAYLNAGDDPYTATWTTFGNTATIFNGENFTRAEFRAVTAVPEADTWAMMAVGVGLIGLQLRRRSASSGSILG